MTRISERNFFPNFSPKIEFIKLYRFFSDQRAFNSHEYNDFSNYSILQLLDFFFDQWKLRGSFTTLEEMMCFFKLRAGDVSDSMSEDKLLDYIQFIFNALFFLSTINISPFYVSNFNSIQDSILHHSELLLKKLNAEIKKIEDEFVVLYKNDVATVVSSQQPELAPSIAEYLAINNRDDLQRKAEVLCSFAKVLERNKHLLNRNEFQRKPPARYILNSD